jgi:hypothetical protein
MVLKTIMRAAPWIGLAIALSPMASASAINGSMGLSFLEPEMNGTNLLTSTVVGNASFTLRNVTAGCPIDSGDYCIVPSVTDFGSFSLNLSGIATGGGLTFTNATYGTFTANFGEIVQQNANFVDVYLTGNYTNLPTNGTTCGGNCASSPTSFRASWTFTGTSLSGSGTLASPPAELRTDISPVPEPLTGMLLGSGLVAIGLFRRRRA